jgi:hypothetical protein
MIGSNLYIVATKSTKALTTGNETWKRKQEEKVKFSIWRALKTIHKNPWTMDTKMEESAQGDMEEPSF